MVIVLSETKVIEDVPRMINEGKCGITCNEATVLEVRQTCITKRLGSGCVFLNGRQLSVPKFVYCISNDGIECLMIVGKDMIMNKFDRVIIPLE